MTGFMNCSNKEKERERGETERKEQEIGRENVIKKEWVLLFDLFFSPFLFV